MATIEKPAAFAAPGEADSPVELKDRYDNFIGGKASWGATSPAERAAVLKAMADAIEANLQMPAIAESWDRGCRDGSAAMCLTEVELPADLNDVVLGRIAAGPFLIDAEQYERWGVRKEPRNDGANIRPCARWSWREPVSRCGCPSCQTPRRAPARC